MGTVVIHAGRPKAGSSSIQAWLRNEVESLRSAGTVLAVASHDVDEATWRVRPYERGGVNSGIFATARQAFPEGSRALDRFFGDVSELADRWDAVVLTSENFANLVAPPDEGFLARLQALAREHTVKVAYYVRPQHQALVASWTQWGFYRHEPASTFLASRARALDYHRTIEDVAQRAPDVDFRVRPLRRDLLHRSSLISDFAWHFLDIDLSDQSDLQENRGLPLDVVNLVRVAPAGIFWRNKVPPGGGEARRVKHERWRRLGPLLQRWELEESPGAVNGRTVVHRYAYERFEGSNRGLIDHLEWPISGGFIEQPPGDLPGDLELVDELWSPGALTPTHRMLLMALCQLSAPRADPITLEPPP